jgi:radical SAM/Cys-rich protein
MQIRHSLSGRGNQKAAPLSPEPFHSTIINHGLRLERAKTTTLQLNVTLKCNQACKHCHLEAGPSRTEMMDRQTILLVEAFARGARFETIDITGGAPELHPELDYMIAKLRPLASRLMIRSNLSALAERDPDRRIAVFRQHAVAVVASLPSINQAQTESQRGKGVFAKSIAMLQKLNANGYGLEGSGLELSLVSNPTGAFLPPSQAEAENRFRTFLQQKWGIKFNRLFTFANVPLGRFRRWLRVSGNFEDYLERLISGFNPCAVEGLMCRTLISVAWDGYLYDCDFNLARGLPLGGRRTHISSVDGAPAAGAAIAVAEHCYTCTAGSGFT